MARYSGRVGFGTPAEKPAGSGVWEDEMVERPYLGDVVRNARRLEVTERLNPNINVSNSISIVADTYAMENFQRIKYVMWMGVRWTVTDVEVRRPRLILSLGEVYNGSTP